MARKAGSHSFNHLSISVTGVSQKILNATTIQNPRVYLELFNTSDTQTAFIGLGVPAVLNTGIAIFPKTSWWLEYPSTSLNDIYIIGTGSFTVSGIEAK